MNRRHFLAALAVIPTAALAEKDKCKPAKVFGKIQFVTSFPDFKVKEVDSFPDLRVQIVEAFPNKPGEWQIVDSVRDQLPGRFLKLFPFSFCGFRAGGAA